MGNTYFRFKQFIINQEKCAMKVGTDGVITGAWADASKARYILDAGTGTGLISMMLAQRFPEAIIDAIDIDNVAVAQAFENVSASPFHCKIRVLHSPIQEWALKNSGYYDMVISNPPFFNRSLKSEIAAKNLARHDDNFPLSDLFSCSYQLLKSEGILTFIYPFWGTKLCYELAEKNSFFLRKQLILKPIPKKEPHRSLFEFSKIEGDIIYSEMNIETGRSDEYSSEAALMLAPFLLKL
jgi:tRNA1Val (adenine37-N6)-methyltransferase